MTKFVLYHKDCLDGFGGAWAAWKKFKNKAKYIPVEHQMPPPKLEKKELYFIDFCYPEEIMKKIVKMNKKVVVIDHHITRKDVVESLPEHVFNLNHSGAILAWEYFHPQIKPPRLLLYIEDNDCYKLKLPDSKEINAALESYEYNFGIWDKLAKDLENKKGRAKLIKEGKIILRYQNQLTNKLIANAENSLFCGKRASIVNSPILSTLIGKRLLNKKNKIAIIWHIRRGKAVVSLRSKNVDVAKLAERYGGGGHRNAAGFVISLKQKILPWK